MGTSDDLTGHALSFGGVADAYDRARPDYPPEAVSWLTGPGRLSVVELGAGTGKLTAGLAAAGHRLLATDPDEAMLRLLRRRVPGVPVARAGAEHIPVASRSVDVVVCAQSFHWFDHERALPEVARVLRPGGFLAVVWNVRDEGIPWVRKLGRIIGGTETSVIEPLEGTPYFGWIDRQRFRAWQALDKDGLLDLVRSRSYIAVLDDPARERILAEVGALYDDYGRGHDGMLLPYLTQCFRAEVHHQEPPPPDPARPENQAQTTSRPPDDGDDPDALLIDFR